MTPPKQTVGNKLAVLLMTIIILNLPIVSALEISNLRVEEITQNSAIVAWDTDEESDSFLYYGTDSENLQSKGDADMVLSHQITVDSLTPATEYKYYVRSKEIIDNNAGNYHSFMTLAPDTIVPTINVTLPEIIKGKELNIRGTTEARSLVNLWVNQQLAASTIADNGNFVFEAVALQENQENNVTITVKDAAENSASVTTIVYSDTSQPKIDLLEIPDFTDKNSISIAGTISESAQIEITVNDRSIKKSEGTTIKEDIQLEEGENKITITAQDSAGWTDQVDLTIISDTQPPTVTATIERGLDYFETRAESDINGKTEPAAKVFLYVYKPLGYEYKPDFENAREMVTADETGAFKFDDVDFSASIFDSSIDILKPKEVPSGLEDFVIFKSADLNNAQSSNYHIFIIVEDRGGRTASWKQTVNVHTCFSQNLDFSVQSLPKFQAPLRLVPQQLDEGRQEIQAVFELNYLGRNGIPKIVNGEEIERGAKVTRILFERACTPGMSQDDKFSIGCKIFPSTGQKNILQNGDGSAAYVTWNLGSTAELSKREKDFWDDFKKRQIVFPLKIRIEYQERTGENQFGITKHQTVCTDLGYFVDIPIESDELIPDFLADEGVEGLDWTIEQLQTVRPYLEKAFLIAGVSCMGSWLFRTAARWVREFTSNMEHYYSWIKSGLKAQSNNNPDAQDENTDVCPNSYRQKKLYFRKEVENWLKLENKENIPASIRNFQSADDPNLKKYLLEERCKKTANAWKFEEAVDKAYKFTCDRAFCRKVPARWTEDKEIEEIQEVIAKQQHCAVTARGIPLQRVENCKNLVKENILHVDASLLTKVEDNGGVCWRTNNDQIYYNDQKYNDEERFEQDVQAGIYRLSPVTTQFADVGQNQAGKLIVYRPEGADTFLVGKDQKCEQVCGNKRKKGYAASTQGIAQTISATAGGKEKNFDIIAEKGTIGGKEYSYAYKSKEDNIIIYRQEDGTPLGVSEDKFGDIKTPYPLDKDGKPKPGDYAKQIMLIQPKVPERNEISKSCFDEEVVDGEVTVVDAERNPIRGDKYAAGYTKDCFLKRNPDGSVAKDGTQPKFQQCVCEGKKVEEKKHENEEKSLRTADPLKPDGKTEEWFYHQDQVFKDSGKTLGTYYPPERYYAGRDFLGAFGQNDILDTIKGTEEIASVSPSEITGAFQTVCLSSILKHTRMLEGMLVGMRNCLVEAKYTGLHDAGACKTLFSQQVCGLIYKGIGYLTSSCHSTNFDDVGNEGTLGDVGVVIDNGFDSLSSAMESSVEDIRDDYGNAALNEYFKGGAQGFAQSICLAAFGYEFPLFSDEFLLDAAYSVPTKTTVLLVPKERELSTYNPALQTAVFNYNIGGIIFPGCRVRKWDVSLKCIGPEDRGRPGIDESCGGKGCDCLNAQQPNGPFENEKTQPLIGGYEIPSGNYFSIPLPSPQKFDKHYRYDHVVVKLELDPLEAGNEDKCFDAGYYEGLTGTFYEPIVDVSPPGELSCRVSLVDGRYVCPELANLFGFGGTYFEEPFVMCYDDKDDNWVSCDTRDLFTEGDIIATRVHVNLDDKGKCVRATVRNVQGITESAIYPLNSGMPGPSTRQINFGTVSAQMFGGNAASLVKNNQLSNSNCNDNPTFGNSPTNPLPAGTQFSFVFEAGTGNTMKLKVPSQASLSQKSVDVMKLRIDNERYVITNEGSRDLNLDLVNRIGFNAGGFSISNVIGSATHGSEQNQCTYQIIGGGSSSAQTQNFREFTVLYELLERDEGGGCFLATQLVKESSAAQPTKKPWQIRIQLKPMVSDEQTGLLAVMNSGNLDALRTMATDIIQRGGNDMTHALAAYYLAAGYIIHKQKIQDPEIYRTAMTNVLRLFFERKWGTNTFAPFDSETQKNLEFQKITAYMCEIDVSMSGNHCSGSSSP